MINFLKSVWYLILCLIPTWIYLIIYNFVEPIGFWQELALLGLGAYFLFGIQLFLLVGWGMVRVFKCKL